MADFTPPLDVVQVFDLTLDIGISEKRFQYLPRQMEMQHPARGKLQGGSIGG
jgi:hypothetical protein